MVTQTPRKPRQVFDYDCEDCGQSFPSKVRRSGPKYCAACIGVRRKEGRGPRQTGEAGTRSGQSGTPRAARAATPAQPEVADLARQLAARHGTSPVALPTTAEEGAGSGHEEAELEAVDEFEAEVVEDDDDEDIGDQL